MHLEDIETDPQPHITVTNVAVTNLYKKAMLHLKTGILTPEFQIELKKLDHVGKTCNIHNKVNRHRQSQFRYQWL